MNEKQREVVKEIGLGCFLSLNMHGLLLKLGKYLLERFSTKNSRLKLEEESVDIDEEDVRLVLGIPGGPKLVEEMNNSDIEDEKYTQYWKDSRIDMGSWLPLLQKMPVNVLGQGDDFKKNFIIYMTLRRISSNTSLQV